MTQDTAANTSNTRRRNRLLLALAGLVAITGVAGAAYWRLHAAHFVSTDNAYAGAEIAQVTPRSAAPSRKCGSRTPRPSAAARCW
ncbi:hypothetical protein [Massilia cavernae]|uniref:hypothetical protein n=1 Tax=Massilia cavernae TaxID=2320864 RepID=UPI00269DCF67|nr:hypothetical protein [Massilia cavernae]